MAGAIRIFELGGPEVLTWAEADSGRPGPGEVRIRHSAIGLNRIDVCHRRGSYPGPVPGGLGIEAAGVIEEVGPGVDHVVAGDRVAYAGGAPGAYAQSRLMSAAPLVRLPDDVTDQHAAALMLKGMVAGYLVHSAYRVSRGETVVVHAVAGGVGLILCQWLRFLGATVIGTVGSEAKAALAKQYGCQHPVLYRKDSLVERVMDLTGGRGVAVVYDCVGAAGWQASLNCLHARGNLVCFGKVSGPITDANFAQLAAKYSIEVTRPRLVHQMSRRSELEQAAGLLFQAVSAGLLKAHIGQTYDLRDAAIAHMALAEGRTVGSTLLLP